jgi:hypothetical protein
MSLNQGKIGNARKIVEMVGCPFAKAHSLMSPCVIPKLEDLVWMSTSLERAAAEHLVFLCIPC